MLGSWDWVTPFYEGSRSMPPLSSPGEGLCVNAKHTWVLGFPKCPQDPIYLLLGIHTGVARPGLEVDGPPSRGGSFSLLLLQACGSLHRPHGFQRSLGQV
jgi:hypothetical protein